MKWETCKELETSNTEMTCDQFQININSTEQYLELNYSTLSPLSLRAVKWQIGPFVFVL